MFKPRPSPFIVEFAHTQLHSARARENNGPHKRGRGSFTERSNSTKHAQKTPWNHHDPPIAKKPRQTRSARAHGVFCVLPSQNSRRLCVIYPRVSRYNVYIYTSRINYVLRAHSKRSAHAGMKGGVAGPNEMLHSADPFRLSYYNSQKPPDCGGS